MIFQNNFAQYDASHYLKHWIKPVAHCMNSDSDGSYKVTATQNTCHFSSFLIASHVSVVGACTMYISSELREQA